MARSARVCHVVALSEVPGAPSFSGAEHHLWHLLPALARDGMDVELIPLLWRGEHFAAVRARLAELEAEGVRVTPVWRGGHAARGPAGRARSLRAWARLHALLRRRRDAVVHLHLELFYAGLVARAAGCRRTVASLHNDEPGYATPGWRRRGIVVDRVVRRYVAISEHVRRHYARAAGVALDKIATVRYGVPRATEPPAGRRALGLAPDTTVVGFVGRLTEQKNVRALVEALARRPRVTGVVVGDGPLRPELEDLARARGASNVRFVGAWSRAERLMPAFDLLCLPSAWEGLGLVLVEGMLREVPVAGSRRGAIPEVLDGGRAGLLFEPTAEDLGATIDRALADRPALRALAARGRRHAERTFTVDAMVSGTRAVYESLG